jgi:hypothetical protein
MCPVCVPECGNSCHGCAGCCKRLLSFQASDSHERQDPTYRAAVSGRTCQVLRLLPTLSWQSLGGSGLCR